MMNVNDTRNPFIIGKYLSDEYFCDREAETAFLRKQIINGRDVALISPRRIGKSGLIQHFFHQSDIKEKYYVFLYALTPTGGHCLSAMIKEAKNNIILSQEGSYKDLMSNLPPRQKIVLQAIAKEGLAKNHHINKIHQEIQSQLCQFSSVCHQVIT